MRRGVGGGQPLPAIGTLVCRPGAATLVGMAAFDTPTPAAIAFQFGAALDAYEADVEALAQARFDPELYRCMSHRIEEMRLYAAALPALSGAWVEVLIRHAELTHGMWRAQHPGAEVDLPRLRSQLHDATRRLARKCAQLLPTA